MRSRHRIGLLVVGVMLAGILAACGGATTTTPTSTAAPTAASGATTSATAAATPATPAGRAASVATSTAAPSPTTTPTEALAAATGTYASGSTAGADCAALTPADGKLYLGISLAGSTGEYQAMVPPDLLDPVKSPLSGIGDGATLYKTDDADTVRFLPARKGSRGVALGPFTTAITDDRLGQLAAKALSHL